MGLRYSIDSVEILNRFCRCFLVATLNFLASRVTIYNIPLVFYKILNSFMPFLIGKFLEEYTKITKNFRMSSYKNITFDFRSAVV